jgi:hypothetical protein
MTYQYKYTDCFDSKLIEHHYLLSVSYQHYWFQSLSDLREFMDSSEFDPRMRMNYPAVSPLDY